VAQNNNGERDASSIEGELLGGGRKTDDCRPGLGLGSDDDWRLA
jgi:hypothetical protein